MSQFPLVRDGTPARSSKSSGHHLLGVASAVNRVDADRANADRALPRLCDGHAGPPQHSDPASRVSHRDNDGPNRRLQADANASLPPPGYRSRRRRTPSGALDAVIRRVLLIPTDREARPPAQRQRDVDVGCSSTFVLRQDQIPECRPDDSPIKRAERWASRPPARLAVALNDARAAPGSPVWCTDAPRLVPSGMDRSNL